MYVCIAIGVERYALPISSTREIVQLEKLTPIPGVTAEIAGVTSLRGRILPVLNLATILGVEGAKDSSLAVVTEVDGHSYALLADSVVDVTDLDQEPSGVESEFLEGVVSVDKALIGVLDMAKVVNSVAREL